MKYDHSGSVISSCYRRFCVSMSLELPTDTYVDKLDFRMVIPLSPRDQQ